MTVESISTESRQKSPWWGPELTAVKQRKNRKLRLFRIFSVTVILRVILNRQKSSKCHTKSRKKTTKRKLGKYTS